MAAAFDNGAKSFLTLSEVLSWLAFGVELDGRACLDRIINAASSGGASEAVAKMDDAILAFYEAAIAGRITCVGRLHDDASRQTPAFTKPIDPLAFHDFTFVDLIENCLGLGKNVPFDQDYEFSACIAFRHHQQHYADVQVDAKSVRTLGKSLKPREPQNPRLADPQLTRWWATLAEQAVAMTEAELLASIRSTYPDKFISRDRVRELMRPRKTGKKPFSDKMSAK